MFNHVDLNLPSLEREHIDGVRYYSIPNEDELVKLVSITSVSYTHLTLPTNREV